MNRYDRQEKVKNWDQEKLKNATVRVIGCGALGNVVIPILSAYGIGRIEFFDNDEIELHNLARQWMFREEDVGKNKAEILQARLRERNSDIILNGFPEKITEDTIEFVLDGSDIIVDCVDNVKTRHLLSKYALEHNIPLVHMGSSPLGGEVGVITRETPCLECLLKLPKEEADASCTDVVNPSVAETNAVIGSIGAGQVRMLLLKLPADRIIKPMLYYNIGKFPVPFNHIAHNKKKDCPVCSKY